MSFSLSSLNSSKRTRSLPSSTTPARPTRSLEAKEHRSGRRRSRDLVTRPSILNQQSRTRRLEVVLQPVRGSPKQEDVLSRQEDSRLMVKLASDVEDANIRSTNAQRMEKLAIVAN